MHNNNSKAFTLIELLAVIGVIAILAGLIIPAVGKAMKSAKRSSEANNMRQIASAYYSYTKSNGRHQDIHAQSLHQWASKLAEVADLNDASLWYIESDPLIQASGKKPRHIGSFHNNLWETNHQFTQFPLSYSLATKIQHSSNPSTTPLLWTRGLQTNGHWSNLDSPTPSPYGSEGGYIVFMDGHVQWYSNLTQDGGQLTHYITKAPTSNILHALPPSASVLDIDGKMYNSHNH